MLLSGYTKLQTDIQCQRNFEIIFFHTYEGCPRSSWTSAVTLSYFDGLKSFLYKIQSKHIRIKNHKYYLGTWSYVAKTSFHAHASVRCPSSYVCQPFSKIFSSETAWPFEAKFHVETPWQGERKFI